MENKFKKENSFLVLLGVCVVILLVVCGISFEFSLRGTWGYFPGGTTGTLGGAGYKVVYYSNWPVEEMEDEEYVVVKVKKYVIENNMFDIPDGYSFLHICSSVRRSKYTQRSSHPAPQISAPNYAPRRPAQ